jgi:hypothetical protein
VCVCSGSAEVVAVVVAAVVNDEDGCDDAEVDGQRDRCPPSCVQRRRSS